MLISPDIYFITVFEWHFAICMTVCFTYSLSTAIFEDRYFTR